MTKENPGFWEIFIARPMFGKFTIAVGVGVFLLSVFITSVLFPFGISVPISITAGIIVSVLYQRRILRAEKRRKRG